MMTIYLVGGDVYINKEVHIRRDVKRHAVALVWRRIKRCSLAMSDGVIFIFSCLCQELLMPSGFNRTPASCIRGTLHNKRLGMVATDKHDPLRHPF